MDDFYFVIAELSLALAGFSGLAVGIRRAGSSEFLRQDVFGISLILTTSGSAMVFSLLPEVLTRAGFENAQTISSILLAGSISVICPWVALQSRGSPPRYPGSFWSFVAIGMGLAITVLVDELGLVPLSGNFTAMLLLWLLLVGFAQFATFLVLAWTNR